LVELGLEKASIVDLPLLVSSNVALYGLAAEEYTEIGENTTTPNSPLFALPLAVKLVTDNVLSAAPPVITLDEYNKYTAFFTVETNNEAAWTLQGIDPLELDVTPTSGTGRQAVVVKLAQNFNWDGEDFHCIPIKAVSAINPLISATVNVHAEKYTTTRNALIPKQTAGTAFDHSLTSAETIATWGTLQAWNGTVAGLNNFPFLEHVFDAPHRVQSWSLQSVGTTTGRRATTLVLWGQTQDDTWKILDIASVTTTSFYTANKPREDRTVHHRLLESHRHQWKSARHFGKTSTLAEPEYHRLPSLHWNRRRFD